jgi:hypothetical protein
MTTDTTTGPSSVGPDRSQTRASACPDLPGFHPYYGVPIASVGDDGDWTIAMGHHDPLRIVAAMNRYARTEIGLRNMLDDPHGTLADALDLLEVKWARLTTVDDCDSRETDLEESGEHFCVMCDEITGGGWWMSWSTDPAPGSFPVTVWPS